VSAASHDDGGGHPSVIVSNRQPRTVDETALAALAASTLVAEGYGRAELSLSFVDEHEMTELHERYMQEPGPTDVLSFPLDDDVDEGGAHLLGDVVVAPAIAARNNPADPDGEMRMLVVHGVLHVLGYDHEEDDARAAMWERQERYSGVMAP
jgi:probable rRNA maturation factor